MADIFDVAKRSNVMSRIRGRGNRDTELGLIRSCAGAISPVGGRHQAFLGRPDFAFRKQRVVVFVDGCFWHGCPRHCKMPTQNAEFWKQKLARNRTRDTQVTSSLKHSGWQVVRIWEHDLKARPDYCVRRIVAGLTRPL